MPNYVKYAHLDQLNYINMLSAFNMIFHLALNIIWCQGMAPGFIAEKLIS